MVLNRKLGQGVVRSGNSIKRRHPSYGSITLALSEQDEEIIRKLAGSSTCVNTGDVGVSKEESVDTGFPTLADFQFGSAKAWSTFSKSLYFQATNKINRALTKKRILLQGISSDLNDVQGPLKHSLFNKFGSEALKPLFANSTISSFRERFGIKGSIPSIGTTVVAQNERIVENNGFRSCFKFHNNQSRRGLGVSNSRLDCIVKNTAYLEKQSTEERIFVPRTIKSYELYKYYQGLLTRYPIIILFKRECSDSIGLKSDFARFVEDVKSMNKTMESTEGIYCDTVTIDDEYMFASAAMNIGSPQDLSAGSKQGNERDAGYTWCLDPSQDPFVKSLVSNIDYSALSSGTASSSLTTFQAIFISTNALHTNPAPFVNLVSAHKDHLETFCVRLSLKNLSVKEDIDWEISSSAAVRNRPGHVSSLLNARPNRAAIPHDHRNSFVRSLFDLVAESGLVNVERGLDNSVCLTSNNTNNMS